MATARNWAAGARPACRGWAHKSRLFAHEIRLICQHGGCLVALHGLIKKTRTTPDDDLALARKRLKEL